jgi:hypothetical protein
MGRLFDPGRFVRRVGTLFGGDHVRTAANVNTLDEVPNSSWFTNRIGLFPITPADAARGPLTGPGPDRSGIWTVIGGKTQGVTPGFTIRDASGDIFFIKFDAPGYARMATAASVISGRIFHNAGYNVPEETIVEFGRNELVVGDDVELELPDGSERTMTETDLDDILQRVALSGEGTWRALAGKLLPGENSGPFDWRGRRNDDPNDTVNHEDRRELRGLQIFAAWLCHFDTKQENTLDMYVEEDGRRFLRHYLIDLASTLGAAANGPIQPFCFEYSVDFAAILGRVLSLGLIQDRWRRLERPPDIDEVGYFESEIFEPNRFKASKPTAAFANLTDRDGYWAAKIISAFNDNHIDAMVEQGKYANPDAARWIARVLAERRDKIARYYFERVPPLDFFVYEDGVLRFHDLGTERGIYSVSSSRYRVRVAASTADRRCGRWTTWRELEETVANLEQFFGREELSSVPISESPFLAVEVQLTRGASWSSTTTVFLARRSGRVVAVDR